VLRNLVKTAAGRKPQPTAAVIDSQSVRAADTVPDVTKKIKAEPLAEHLAEKNRC